jgi:phosphoribosylglycinamide formyltransferase-1
MRSSNDVILSEAWRTSAASGAEGSAVALRQGEGGASDGRKPSRLGILLSGRGSNFLAIVESIRSGRLKNVEIVVVISNVAEAPGLKKACELGLETAVFVSKSRKREEHDADVAACLKAHGVDLVCLAGYMRLLSPHFVAAFPHRILNIHPSLLPAFPGLDAQEQAFNYGVKATGCTVHFVDEELDHGAIVVQRAIPVLETDDAHSLAERILKEEHIAYTEAIARVVNGEYEVRGRKFMRTGNKGSRDQGNNQAEATGAGSSR